MFLNTRKPGFRSASVEKDWAVSKSAYNVNVINRWMNMLRRLSTGSFQMTVELYSFLLTQQGLSGRAFHCNIFLLTPTSFHGNHCISMFMSDFQSVSTETKLFSHLVTTWHFSPGYQDNPDTCTLDYKVSLSTLYVGYTSFRQGWV